MHLRDIPFDEECPERSDTFRETFGEPCSLADLEAARRKWADNLDRDRERDTASAGWATREKAEAAVEACKMRLR